SSSAVSSPTSRRRRTDARTTPAPLRMPITLSPRHAHGALARRMLAAFSLAAAGIALQAGPALAHVTVWPRTAAPGAFERYVIRVPNEKNSATTRVEIHFPAEVRISSFLDVPGWNLQVLTDSAGKITGAVWTGTLPPKRFVEFPFIGVNPKTGTSRLVW